MFNSYLRNIKSPDVKRVRTCGIVHALVLNHSLATEIYDTLCYFYMKRISDHGRG